jgi:hypothetical protein
MLRRWASRLAALTLAAAAAVPSHAEPLVDLGGAVAAAGQQTRALFTRLGDLHKSQAEGRTGGGIRTDRLNLAVDDKPVPLRAFSRLVPPVLKSERTGSFGSFLSGAGTLSGRGIRFNTTGLTAGGDLRLAPRTSVGVAGGFVKDCGVSGGTLALYGAHGLGGGLAVDGLAGFGAVKTDGHAANLSFAGAGARWEWRPTDRLRLGARSRLSFAGADVGKDQSGPVARAGLLTTLFGAGGSYRFDFSWGNLMPQASVEYVQDSTGAVPPMTSLHLGLTAATFGSASLSLDHATEMGRSPGGSHAVRAALKMRF